VHAAAWGRHDPDSIAFGTAVYGGEDGDGTIFRFEP